MNPAIIKRTRVQLDAQPARPSAAAGASTAAASHSDKSVRLLEHEGRVRAIELTCSCGDVSVIELDYPDTSPPQEAPA